MIVHRFVATRKAPDAVFAILRQTLPAVWIDAGRRVGLALVERGESRDPAWILDPTGPVAARAPSRRPLLDDQGRRVPLVTGWLGWLGYEAGRSLDRGPAPGPIPPLAGRPLEVPDAWLGRVEATAWWRPEDGGWGLAGRPDAVARLEALLAAAPIAISPPGPPAGRRVHETSRERFVAAVRRVLRHLRDGDCYQVNLARRVDVAGVGDGFDAWRRVRRLNHAARGMYLETPGLQVVSNSPELLLAARPGPTGLDVVSAPIKGTAPWLADAALRAEAALALLHSPKERAELTMIVDLVRADLGPLAVPGTVRADARRVGRVGHVLHAVQRVHATVPPAVTAVDVLRRLFVAGSVTGAPRVRAMEVIRALEGEPRGVYCGSLGWFGDDGSARWNVAIRTITVRGGDARFHVGAGIVIGSEPEAEYAETVLKAARMAEALEAR